MSENDLQNRTGGSRLSGTWEPAVLIALADGPKRSAEVRREVSRRLDYCVFRDTTERLVNKHLVQRVEDAGTVTFTLTDAGRVIFELLARHGSLGGPAS